MPVDRLASEAGEFRNTHAGVEERPDDEAFFGGHAGVGEPSCFIGCEGLANELILGHVAIVAGKRQSVAFAVDNANVA